MGGSEQTPQSRLVWLKWLAALGLPLALVGLFKLLQRNKALMGAWVSYGMAPMEQMLGRLWSLLPFSVAELLTALVLAAGVVWLVRAVVLLIRRREPIIFLRRLLAAVSAALWLWCGLCWLWNASYYAPDFTEKSGLSADGHTAQELLDTTVWFAQNAARLSDQIQRDEQSVFAEVQEDYFRNGVTVYDNLAAEFPFLDIPAVQAKPLVCSRLQSILGFTGVYFPFTGEANVNTAAPAALRPATIAHEMAHQRMVASEAEANFVGIAACVTSDDTVYQYSGFLLGLIQLSNTLYDVDPQAWSAVVDTYFTPELSADWNDNYYYWKALESPVDDAATQTYDSFLKGNGQSLGIESYGACVDLLITYFCPEA
jgi:hypothetical protein